MRVIRRVETQKLLLGDLQCWKWGVFCAAWNETTKQHTKSSIPQGRKGVQHHTMGTGAIWRNFHGKYVTMASTDKYDRTIMNHPVVFYIILTKQTNEFWRKHENSCLVLNNISRGYRSPRVQSVWVSPIKIHHFLGEELSPLPLGEIPFGCPALLLTSFFPRPDLQGKLVKQKLRIRTTHWVVNQAVCLPSLKLTYHLKIDGRCISNWNSPLSGANCYFQGGYMFLINNGATKKTLLLSIILVS